MPLVGESSTQFSTIEIQFIQSNYITDSDYDMSVELRRSVQSIRLKRQRLGLNRWKISPLTGRKELITLPTLMEIEVTALEHYIASDPPSILKDIAYDRLEVLFRTKIK